MIYYDKVSGGFYSTDFHAAIPDGAVGISEESHAALLAGQSAGKVIAANEDGFPVLEDPAPPNPEQVLKAALGRRDALLRQAAVRIGPLQDAVDLDVHTEDEVARLKAWKQYRVDLMRLAISGNFPLAPDWPVLPAG